MNEPQVGDILEYGSFSVVVAAVTSRRVLNSYDEESEEFSLWEWRDEPEEVILSGGGTGYTLLLERREVVGEGKYPPEGYNVRRTGQILEKVGPLKNKV